MENWSSGEPPIEDQGNKELVMEDQSNGESAMESGIAKYIERSKVWNLGNGLKWKGRYLNT